MKKIFLYITILLICAGTTNAQRIHGYVSAGTATSQVEGDELKGFSHWGLHGGVGAVTALDDRDRFSLTVEADYTCRGIYNRKYNAENLYNIKLDLHYVDIPVTFFFRDPYGGLRIGAGLVYSRLVSQPHGVIAYRPSYFIPDTTNMKFLKNDISAALEARFTIWKGLQFSTRFQYSIFPVKKDWAFDDHNSQWKNNCYNSSLTFRLIWEFGYDERPGYHRKSKGRGR